MSNIALTVVSGETVALGISIPGVQGPGITAGGTAGQALVKNSSIDYDTTWSDMASIGLAAGLSIALG